MIQRVEDVEGELQVGRYYLVRAILYPWYGKLAWWPILGPAHTDAEFFAFTARHFHIDARFVSDYRIRHASARWSPGFELLFNAPLASRGLELPKPERRRLRCARAKFEYPFPLRREIQEINAAFAGRQAKRAKTGWICPHRRALLNGFPPDGEGVITCPLHGLRIDGASGRCIGAKAHEAAP